jgi:hypothetical protein
MKTATYSEFYFASKSPFFVNTSSTDANEMNLFNSEPYIINTVNKPVFR